MNPLKMPLVALQGYRTRARAEVLPEAAGPLSGSTVGADEQSLRVMVVGESTAAGCGAATHDEAFAGGFSRALSRLRGRPVRWEVCGRNGATIRRVRYRMLPELASGADAAVLLIGVNDVLTRTPVAQWRDDLTAVVDALRGLAERTVVAGIPPFDAFPSLPRALGTYLGERGRALDAAAQEICSTRDRVSWIGAADLDLARALADASFFARDGFHPSPVGYQRWASGIAEALAG